MKTIYVKNMVCPRCISSVKTMLDDLGITFIQVGLGEVLLKNDLNEHQHKKLAEELKTEGFELLEDEKQKLINQIKSTIIDTIHHQDQLLPLNFSELLSDKLHQEYSSLSKLFSSKEGITIEKYVIRQKIEKVKEFIHYNEMSLSEIAVRLNYSSVAYLSSQFKKETGMTITAFKKMTHPSRKSIDSL